MLRRRIAHFVERFFQSLACGSQQSDDVQEKVSHAVAVCVPPHRATVLPGCSCIFGISKKGCKFPNHTPGVPIPSLHLDYRGHRTMRTRVWQPLLPRVKDLELESELGAHETIHPATETPILETTIFSPSCNASSPNYLKPPMRHALLISDAVRVFFKCVRLEDTAAEARPHIRKNTDRHEILFVHKGAGFLETVFGDILYRGSQYLVIPRGIDYRVVATEPSVFFVFELKDYPYPAFFENEERFPFSENDLIVPKLFPKDFTEKKKTRVLQVTDTRAEKHFYDSSPFMTMAWSGCYYPYAISVERIRSLPESPARGLDRHLTFVAVNEAGVRTALVYTVAPFFHSSLKVYEDTQYDTLWLCHRKGNENALAYEEGEFAVYPRGSAYHHEDHAGGTVSVVLQTLDRWYIAHMNGVRSIKGYDPRAGRRNPDYD